MLLLYRYFVFLYSTLYGFIFTCVLKGWSADNNYLAVVNDGDSYNIHFLSIPDLKVVDLSVVGEVPSQNLSDYTTFGINHFEWSTHGHRGVYVGPQGDHYELVMLNLDDNSQQVFSLANHVGFMNLSPNGKNAAVGYIRADKADPSGVKQIDVYRADGSSSRVGEIMLAVPEFGGEDSYVVEMAWLSDNQSLIYIPSTSSDPTKELSLIRYHADTRKSEVLIPKIVDGYYLVSAPSGQAIALYPLWKCFTR